MSEKTSNLSLPYIMAAQAQKHVTHNEALRKLDALVQISVEDRDLAAPPSTPSEGTRYIVDASATGDWTGKDGQLAAFQDGVWETYPPVEGWIVWVKDEEQMIVFDGTAWVSTTAAAVEKFGINTTADTTNRLAVQSDAILFNHDGTGVQTKLNKSAESDTASVLFQTGFSGRAEFGTAGDDDFHVKVSPDGSTFHEALVIDKDDGVVDVQQGMKFKGGSDVLEFYEQGVWTPTMIGTSGGVGTAVAAYGTYSRIGNLTFCSMRLAITDYSTISGIVAISGLPFNKATVSGFPDRYTAPIGLWDGITLPAGSSTLVGWAPEADRIRLMGGPSAYLNASALTGSSVTIYMSFTYIAV